MFEKLRTTRKVQGITCEDLAVVLNLHTRGAYHKKENGTVPFKLSEAKIIADFFNMKIDDIFFDNEVS